MHEVPKRVTTESWRNSGSERQQNEDACSVYKDMQTILRGSFNCAANSTCKNVTMKNNEANQHGGGGGGGNPWHCKFIQTYAVAGNSPPGAESCMEHSMNRTKIEEERKTNNVTVQAENLLL